ncbi:hypothetical protein CEUSTIGMA_g6796.t1 [Chlamydomonas eustigma]|uniref:Uncharacterized protein n=1 Tax=Chlamydomonas eustigma TaxID=1157962 RepID=A0A250X8F0_9CHLO|nr:hypothetical protein CEUSTIGMA_g6796.t1 [Chlamydomonas eustigma]|eukprot:GAX79354.1 hypothetical protein CEUSTIGMA_g6796.t1 [Chlamydomonas eustigma]
MASMMERMNERRRHLTERSGLVFAAAIQYDEVETLVDLELEISNQDARSRAQRLKDEESQKRADNSELQAKLARVACDTHIWQKNQMSPSSPIDDLEAEELPDQSTSGQLPVDEEIPQRAKASKTSKILQGLRFDSIKNPFGERVSNKSGNNLAQDALQDEGLYSRPSQTNSTRKQPIKRMEKASSKFWIWGSDPQASGTSFIVSDAPSMTTQKSAPSVSKSISNMWMQLTSRRFTQRDLDPSSTPATRVAAAAASGQLHSPSHISSPTTANTSDSAAAAAAAAASSSSSSRSKHAALGAVHEVEADHHHNNDSHQSLVGWVNKTRSVMSNMAMRILRQQVVERQADMGSDLSAKPPSDDRLAHSQEEIARRHAELAAKVNIVLPQELKHLVQPAATVKAGSQALDGLQMYSSSNFPSAAAAAAGTNRVEGIDCRDGYAQSRVKIDTQSSNQAVSGYPTLKPATVLNPRFSTEASTSSNNTPSLSSAVNHADDVMSIRRSAAEEKDSGGALSSDGLPKQAGSGRPLAGWQEALAGKKRGSKNNRSQVFPLVDDAQQPKNNRSQVFPLVDDAQQTADSILRLTPEITA